MSEQKKAKKQWKYRLWLNLPVSLALIVLASVSSTIVMFGIQPSTLQEIWAHVEQSGYVTFWMNWLPVFLTMLLLYYLFNNIVLACGLPFALITVFSLINENKIYMRQDPFKPYDILLGGEVLGIAKSIDPAVLARLGWTGGAFLLFFLLCLFFIKNKKVNAGIRITGTACALAFLVWVNQSLLSNKELYENLYVSGNRYNLLDNYQSKGFLYSFLHALNTNQIDKPAAYDLDEPEIVNRIKAYTYMHDNTSVTPNIILVLSEAFSEITLSPALSFDGLSDPLANYKKIKQESISGRIVVPNIGGGTSDTEFDIFTGVSSRHFRGTAYSYALVAKPITALPSLLSSAGYENIAIHPGYGWFYNRQNVLPHLGFSRFVDINSFDQTDQKGMYITEEQTIRRLIEEYQRHMDKRPEYPFFEFCITIQNHGPYKDKYLETQENFKSAVNLSPNAVNTLSNYIEGMLDCDRELGVLVDYLRSRPEPVVLVYYGDHLPSLSDEVYDALLPAADRESFQGWTRLYQTPFIIWQNAAAKNKTLIDANFRAMGLTENWTISSNYLGMNLLSLLGFDGLDPFMDYVNELSVEYPVIMEDFYFNKNYELIEPKSQGPEPFRFYHSWEYYKIFN